MSGYTVQEGVLVFGASSKTATVTLPRPVDPGHAFPLLQTSLHGSAGRQTASTSTLATDDTGGTISGWDGFSFTVTRPPRAESADHAYPWAVIADELPEFRRAQHGMWVRSHELLLLGVGVSQVDSDAISSIVDYGRCIPWITGIRSTASGQEQPEANVAASMLSSKKVRLERSSTFNTAPTLVSVAVCEYGDAWTVANNLTVDYPNGILTHEVSGAGSDPWAQKLIVATGRDGSAGTNVRDHTFMARPKAGDADTIQVNAHSSSTGVPLTENRAILHALSHPLLAVEHRNTTDDGLTLLAGESPTQALLDGLTASERERLSLHATMACRGAGQYPAQCWGWHRGDGEIQFQRGRSETATDSVWFAYQAALWPTFPAPGAAGPSRFGVVGPTLKLG